MSVEVIRSALLESVPHGFLGRRGGVSTGICAGLNVGLGSGDDKAAVRENRRLAVESVARGAQLVTLHQVHSPTAIRVFGPYPDDARPHADAMVSDRPGLALGILTADCTPVLFADPEAGVIGAAHAGWKGALGGVIEATVAGMEKLGARRERIAAAAGPAIARRSYEVDEASSPASSPRTPTTSVSSPAAARGTTSSISKPMSCPGLPRRAFAAWKRSASTPMPTRTASTATAAPRIAANRIMAGRSA
jgi:YfiH family protein